MLFSLNALKMGRLKQNSRTACLAKQAAIDNTSLLKAIDKIKKMPNVINYDEKEELKSMLVAGFYRIYV